MDPGTAVLIGAFLATLGWYATVRNNHAANRRQHTYLTITRQHDDKRFEESLLRIRAVLKANDVPDPATATRQDDLDKIDYLLNHYEFLSAAIWCGDIDERLIRSCEYSRMTKLYRKMEQYINESRVYREQHSMYENLELIVERWETDHRTKWQRFAEFVMQRPFRSPPSVIRLFKAIYP